MVGMFAGGCLFMLYLSSIFFRRAGEVAAALVVGSVFVLVAGYSATLAISAWRTRRTPLSIESNGRVSYGEQELCAAGSVRSVRIAAPRREPYDCEVALEVAGTRVGLHPVTVLRYLRQARTRPPVRREARRSAERSSHRERLIAHRGARHGAG